MLRKRIINSSWTNQAFFIQYSWNNCWPNFSIFNQPKKNVFKKPVVSFTNIFERYSSFPNICLRYLNYRFINYNKQINNINKKIKTNFSSHVIISMISTTEATNKIEMIKSINRYRTKIGTFWSWKQRENYFILIRTLVLFHLNRNTYLVFLV